MDKRHKNLIFQLSILFKSSQNMALFNLKYNLNQNFRDLNSSQYNLLQIKIL